MRVLFSSSSDDGVDGKAVMAMLTIMGAIIVLMDELIVLKAICKG